jgi:anti-sigma regulatory factor (Ser/Thr protein kinase)
MDTRVHEVPLARALSEPMTPRGAVGLATPIVRAVDIPGTAASVALGRRFVDSVLDELDLVSRRDEVVLMASELLTNSVLHGRGSVGLVVTWLAPFLEVAVTDQGSGMGRRTAPGTFSTSGRGLHLVEQLATRCGTRGSATETTVWFALLIDPCQPADTD